MGERGGPPFGLVRPQSPENLAQRVVILDFRQKRLS